MFWLRYGVDRGFP